MKVDSKLLQKFKEALSDENLRFTNQRLFVLEDILSSNDHRDCDQIYNSLCKNNRFALKSSTNFLQTLPKPDLL